MVCFWLPWCASYATGVLLIVGLLLNATHKEIWYSTIGLVWNVTQRTGAVLPLYKSCIRAPGAALAHDDDVPG